MCAFMYLYICAHAYLTNVILCAHMYQRTHMKCIYNVSPSHLSSELAEGVKLGALANSVGLPAWLWVFS